MGYYLPSDRPPSRWQRWTRRLGKYVPHWLKSWWQDISEIVAITRVVLGIILPVVGLLMVFVLLCAGALLVLAALGSGR